MPTHSPPLRILVTDSHSRAALAATRALGRAGHWLLTSGTDSRSLACASRYSCGFEQYPVPSADVSDFVAVIADICRRHRIDVLIAATELTTRILVEHAEKLPACVTLPCPSFASFMKASDKVAMHQLAESCGVPVPRSEYLASATEIWRCDRWDSYPAVVKPSRSQALTSSGWTSLGVRYAESAEDIRRILRDLPGEAYPVMVQERIAGPGTAIFTCMDRGRPLTWFAHERIREKPPSGGVSVLCRSIRPDVDAVKHAMALLKSLDWHGVAMVEFKRDIRDGSLRLMEINGRLWGSLQLAIDAGVNFPVLLADLAAGRKVQTIDCYRLDVMSRWFWGDFSSLLMYLTKSRHKLSLPAGHPGRLSALWDFLKLWKRGMHYEIEQLSDFAPACLEFRQMFRLIRRIHGSGGRT